ncbi:hypothetical protein [Thermosphaera sp.]
MLTAQQKEELRHAILEYLYARPMLAFAPAAIGRMCYRRGLVEFEPSEEQAREALEFLRGLQLVERIRDPLGGSVCYQITTAGQLARERGEV